MADLMRGRLADDIVGVECRQSFGFVRSNQRRFVLSSRLALVQRDEHRDLRVRRLLHQDVIEFIVVIAEHIEVQRTRTRERTCFKMSCTSSRPT